LEAIRTKNAKKSQSQEEGRAVECAHGVGRSSEKKRRGKVSPEGRILLKGGPM